MKKLSVDDKRTLDSVVTGQLLGIDAIRAELINYANAFIEAFNADTYRLFDQITLHELAALSVKGGLGIENLRAQAAPNPPNNLVWNTYKGDCDLNLLIRRDRYPAGKTTGQVMAAVAQRVKILLVQTIGVTRYCTLVQQLEAAQRPNPRQPGPLGIRPPLYLCNQIQALALLVNFVGQDMRLPINNNALPPPVNLNNPRPTVDVMAVAELFSSVIPGLVGIGGPDLQKVFDYVSAKSQFLVYYDPDARLFFVSNLQYVRSTWADVDYSFFPYAPGRMDSLGYEVTELAMDQIRARQVKRSELPYDVFKVTNTPFSYTSQDLTNARVSPYEEQVFTADDVGLTPGPTGGNQGPYNISMYANNLIDDFALIRAGLLFPGYCVNTVRGSYTVPVSRGTAKCEFVDVAIPRIASPEWYYLQDRNYYLQVPRNPAPNQSYFKVCNWEYQTEENLNLLIELSAGHSHSSHKQTKRIDRLAEAWKNCDMATVFPRSGSGARPLGVAQFVAPAVLVENCVRDYETLYGLKPLPDDRYVFVFERLYDFYAMLLAYESNYEANLPDDEVADLVDPLIEAAKQLGRIGLQELVCMADTLDGPDVTKLRGLVKDGAIAVNWVLAAYLLLKAGTVQDLVWFPTQAVFEVRNAARFAQDYAVANVGQGDYVTLDFLHGVPGQVFALHKMSVNDMQCIDQDLDYVGELTLVGQRLLDKVRKALLTANNQMLRIAYGQMLNALLRVNAESYMRDVIPS